MLAGVAGPPGVAELLIPSAEDGVGLAVAEDVAEPRAVGEAGGMAVTVTVAESPLALGVLGVPELELGVPFAPVVVVLRGVGEVETAVGCGVPLASAGAADAASTAARAAARRKTPATCRLTRLLRRRNC